VALSAACGLATLVNPYHIELYAVVLDYATHQAPLSLIRELQALEFRAAWEWVVLGLALTSAFCLGRKRPLSSFDVLLLAAAAYFTFRGRRDVWMMALAAAALVPVGQSGERLAEERAVSGLRFTLTRRRAAFAAVAVLLLALGIGWAKGLSEESLERAVAETYPQAAVAVIEERGYAGPLFNDFNWGSYLMWQLPRLKVSIDGRSNMHGDQRVQQSFDTWAALPGWEQDRELAAAKVVLANKATALAAQLRVNPHFQIVYEDDLALVLVPAPAAPLALRN
jgi:hypothetical protein